jgi:hypothetical protein
MNQVKRDCPIGQETREPSADWETWEQQLASCKLLKDGWNGYTAPAPSERAIKLAAILLDSMRNGEVAPTRVGPSAMGGVAVTRKVGDRKVLVELYNDGRVFALFSDRRSNDLPVEEIKDTPESFASFIMKMRDYTDG